MRKKIPRTWRWYGAWNRHAVLGEGVWLLLAEHVANMLLARSDWIWAGDLASKGHSRRLLLKDSWMLVALALARRVLGIGTWPGCLRDGVPWLPRCASVVSQALCVLVRVLRLRLWA